MRRARHPAKRLASCCFAALLAAFLVHPVRAQSNGAEAQSGRVLRVCADPNNLPFSNRRGEGFENKLAELVARELHARLEYTWWAQRRGFLRNTLETGACELVPGIPSGFERVATTRPYYRSSYVFVSRRDRGIEVASLEDPALRRLRIGVQLIGDDAANTPPGHALARRGIVDNVVGYPIYGDYRMENPPARIIDAVEAGDLDLAIVWGPLAGYFAQRQPEPLRIVPVSPQIDLPALQFVFDIAMGVRKGEETFRDELDAILTRRRGEIDAILARYGVPRLDAAAQGSPS